MAETNPQGEKVGSDIAAPSPESPTSKPGERLPASSRGLRWLPLLHHLPYSIAGAT